jgi:hypothetical protein
MWYQVVYTKRLDDCTFYVDGVFVSVIRDTQVIRLPDNAAISLGRDHSRLNCNQLYSCRIGIVSV